MHIAAGEFKATCLKLMDDLSQSNEKITITKRGKAVAQLIPMPEDSDQSLFGYLKDSVISYSNIMDPIEEKWDAES
ncbi:MAG: type II toxin-antitoxin system prevent-host-death family antitoxin [Spartobacteria bacterium]|nr:type II toxin-antitoxin system prevent-host-death family antitoxin [Spartobacteria bacterium]